MRVQCARSAKVPPKLYFTRDIPESKVDPQRAARKVPVPYTSWQPKGLHHILARTEPLV